MNASIVIVGAVAILEIVIGILGEPTRLLCGSLLVGSAFCKFSADAFVRRIAGGKEPSEVFDELIDRFSNREFQRDSAF